MANPSQVAAVAGVFDSIAEDHDRSGIDFFVPFAQALVDAVDPQIGDRCLDLGCGPGTATAMVAERVGPTGRVTGVDVSTGMLERARGSHPGGVQLAPIDFVQGNVQDPDLPADNHDIVVAAMVLFFLPSPNSPCPGGCRWSYPAADSGCRPSVRPAPGGRT